MTDQPAEVDACALSGHSWDVIETPIQPAAVVCSRCGRCYQVDAVSVPAFDRSVTEQVTPDMAVSVSAMLRKAIGND